MAIGFAQRWNSNVGVALAAAATVTCSGGAFRGDTDAGSRGGTGGGPTIGGDHENSSGGGIASGGSRNATVSGGSRNATGGASAAGANGGTAVTGSAEAGTDAGDARDGSDNDAGRATGGSGNGGSSSGGASNGGTGSGGVLGSGGSGGVLGSGGSGGSAAGGSAAVSPPPSWVSSLTAAYFFEGSSTTLGNEANGRTALNLAGDGTSPSFFPSRDLTTFIQGASSAKLPGASDGTQKTFLASSLPMPAAFQTPPGTSFTMGGWFRIDPSRTADQEWLIHDAGPGAFAGGYILAIDQTPQAANPVRGRFSDGDAEVYCKVGSSDEASNYLSVHNVGADARAPAGWVHLICRHDAVANRLAVFVGGALSAQMVSPGVGPGRGPFMVGYNDGEHGVFVGNADEVFFTRAALTDEQINRVYACGLEGARCRCQTASPTRYATCGFAQNGGGACPATTLTPCNASLAPP